MPPLAGVGVRVLVKAKVREYGVVVRGAFGGSLRLRTAAVIAERWQEVVKGVRYTLQCVYSSYIRNM